MISRRSEHSDVAVLIPLRSLWRGKQRLRDVLDESERAELIVSMATTVLNAARGLDVLVVHDDPDVADWAARHGAQALRPETLGLNQAVTAGRAHLARAGYRRVIVAHADLPRARDLTAVLDGSAIGLVADRHGDGTNVLTVPVDLDFRFAYGSGSFDAHCEMSRRLGIEPTRLDLPDLAWDVDHPDDLATHPTGEPQ